MNPDRLLQHYERIADTPDAIARLRRFILDLAVRGKLVPQDANDEPASNLLKLIAKEKARLANAGAARGDNAPPVVPPDQHAFPLPGSWAWVPATFPAFGVSDWGKKVQTKDVLDSGAFPVVDQGKVRVRGYCDDPAKVIKVEAPMIVFGDHTRETKLIDFDFVVGADGVKLLQPVCIEPRYYFLALQWLPLESRGYGRHFKLLKASAIPLPPLAEQRRIVAKVDELMGLCDRLEAARAGREAARDRLAATSLGRLNALNPETFEADARFALDALPALTTRPDQIRRLRQTLLDLAVRGKLVPRDANDEPASALLMRIAKERAELAKRKEIRREDPLDPVQRAELPFDVPASWVWSRIGEAVLFTQYGTSQKSNPSENGVPVLTMGNIQDGLVIWSNEKRIPESSEDLPALYLRRFDLLYNRTNSAELVGKTGIYLGEDGVRTFASYLIRLRPSLLSSNPHFLNMAMNTPEFRETQIVPLIKKQTGQANVNGTALKNMLIPLPPLAEQHRIVAKVDALMALCDRLEASLTATAATRRRLLDALLSEALAPAEDRELKAAE